MVTINVERDGLTGKLQLSINDVDESGSGSGYRIAGPKFNGTSTTLLSAPISRHDAKQIIAYLEAVQQ